MLEEARTGSVVSIEGSLRRVMFSLVAGAAAVWALEVQTAVRGCLDNGFSRED